MNRLHNIRFRCFKKFVHKSGYIESIHFDGDPLLDYQQRSDLENRGGSGIVLLEKKGTLHLGRRDIILGKNIPGYPK